MSTPKDFFDFAKKNNATMVDLKFVDLLGTWQHCTFPISYIDEKSFSEGLGFDGSSIRGWKAIHQSDMMAVPDPDTVVMDPFFAKSTVSILANIVDPVSREEYNRDPRHIARKKQASLISLIMVPSPNSLFLMKFDMSRINIPVCTLLTLWKDLGILHVSKSQTSVISRRIKAVIFL